jgi:hypothetical protein
MNILNYKKIIQFSPIRTGSTLVYNIINRIFKDVVKTHFYNYEEQNLYFITIRHPYNSIISKILVLDEQINFDTINKYTNIYLDFGGRSISNNNLDKPNVIILYYEDFFNNLFLIFEKIEEKLLIKIDDKLKNELIEEFKIDNVKKIASNYKNFHSYDNVTHIHGNHISKYKGETDYKKILSLEQINYLKSNNDLNIILEKYYGSK